MQRPSFSVFIAAGFLFTVSVTKCHIQEKWSFLHSDGGDEVISPLNSLIRVKNSSLSQRRTGSPSDWNQTGHMQQHTDTLTSSDPIPAHQLTSHLQIHFLILLQSADRKSVVSGWDAQGENHQRKKSLFDPFSTTAEKYLTALFSLQRPEHFNIHLNLKFI